MNRAISIVRGSNADATHWTKPWPEPVRFAAEVKMHVGRKQLKEVSHWGKVVILPEHFEHDLTQCQLVASKSLSCSISGHHRCSGPWRLGGADPFGRDMPAGPRLVHVRVGGPYGATIFASSANIGDSFLKSRTGPM